MARLDRAATASSVAQVRASALAEKALEAQANIATVTAKAAENLTKAKEKAIATEAKYSAELKKSQAALAQAVSATQNVAVPAAATKAVDKASAQLKKDELAVTKAEEQAEKSLSATRLAAYNTAQTLQDKILKQKERINRAEEDAALQSRKTANIVKNAPDSEKGAIAADAARLAESRSLQKVNDLRQGAIRLEKQYNDALLKGSKDVALAEEAGADLIAAASNKVIATKQQLAEAVTAANVAQGTAAEAAREAEYAAASRAAQADAALAASRIASENSVLAVTERDEALIEQAKVQSATASKAAADASAAASAEAGKMSGIVKTGLIATGVAALATAAVITKVGFGFNSTKESATAAFTGIIKDAPKANAFMDELYAWTRKTSLGFDTAVHSAQEFLARGIKLDQIIPIMDTIAEAAAKIPAPMEQTMQRISYAIGQISQSAKLHSQDIRQLTEAGIEAWRYLSEATGASIDDMQKDAEKFGLTGPRVAEIILAGMRKDSAGMLQIQTQTGRGQIAIAQRNFQELSGIFTQPFYQKFVDGLKIVNDALSDPSVKSYAQEYGQNIADGMDIAIVAVNNLIKLLNSLPEIKIPAIKLPGTGINLPGTDTTIGVKQIANSFLDSFIDNLTLGMKGRLSKVMTAKNFLEDQGFIPTKPSNTQERVDRLLDRRNILSREANNYDPNSSIAQKLRSQIAAVDSDIEMYTQALNGSGNAAGAAAAKIMTATSSIEASWQKAAAAAKAGIEKTRADLAEIEKSSGHDTREGLQAQYDLEKYKVDTQPRVDFLQQGLKDLDRDARHAAEATRAEGEAKDKEIQAFQRSIDARDRAEQRADMVERMSLSSSEKAAKALDDFDRATQRATLAQGKSASDKLQEQFDAQDRAESRKDLQDAIHDAHGRKDRRKAEEALAKFDRDTQRKQQLQALKDAEERQKNAEALARMDKEDAIRRLKEQEDKKQQQKELTRFDRATKEGQQLQKLQDQRDAITKAGEDIQRAFETKKEALQDELNSINDQKGKLESIAANYDIAVKNALLLAKLADPEKLPKQDDLMTTLNGIVDSFKKFYKDLEEAQRIGADIQKARVQREIEEPPASFNLPGRALGGYVEANKAYIVGENRPEVFIPSGNGFIANSLAAYAAEFARKTWPGVKRMEQGEVSAALDGLQGYYQHQKLSQDWIDAYLPYVRQLEQQQQQQNRVTAVGGGSGNGGNSTVNNDHKTLHNHGQININMGNNGRPNNPLDYIFQRF